MVYKSNETNHFVFVFVSNWMSVQMIGTPQRHVRGRYAKFNGAMDVLVLEALRNNNPFTAKHGTRLQMWQNIAETVGEELFKNPEAYSWHTCR